MMSGENPERGLTAATTNGDSPVSFMVYVPDCDARFTRAVAAEVTVNETTGQPIRRRSHGQGTLPVWNYVEPRAAL
jgi:hypothetical protein